MIDEIHNEAKTGMDKAVAHAADEFAAIIRYQKHVGV